MDCLRPQLESSIYQGKLFLQEQIEKWAEPDFIWRGKAVYGIGIIAEAYTIAAMRTSTQHLTLGKAIKDLCVFAEPSIRKIKQISTLQYFADMPQWLVRACITEGYLYLPVFDSMRQQIVTHEVKQQRHFNLVPFALVASGRSRGASIAPQVNLMFMILCALLYEIDHYMEDVIGSFERVEINEVRQMVHQIFDQTRDESSKRKSTDVPLSGAEGLPQNLAGVRATLSRVTSWVLDHPKVLSSSLYDQAVLRRELKAFYLGQITSIFESSSLALSRQFQPSSQNITSPKLPSSLPDQTFHKWVHTTAADHIAGLPAFAFLACLLNPCADGSDCFPGAEAKYLAQDLSLHIASLCRIENDIGSVARDRRENNLNSADFPEFLPDANKAGGEDDDVGARVTMLGRIARYERECYERPLGRLRELGLDGRLMRGLRAYCNVADLYGQIYAMEDISPRLERCS